MLRCAVAAAGETGSKAMRSWCTAWHQLFVQREMLLLSAGLVSLLLHTKSYLQEQQQTNRQG
jgi:hypothetical protein